MRGRHKGRYNYRDRLLLRYVKVSKNALQRGFSLNEEKANVNERPKDLDFLIGKLKKTIIEEENMIYYSYVKAKVSVALKRILRPCSRV